MLNLTQYAFRTHPRCYGTSLLYGHEALAMVDDDQQVSVLINDVAAVVSRQYPVSVFYASFLPDFLLVVPKVAALIHSGSRTIKHLDPIGSGLLHKIEGHYNMATKSAPTSHAAYVTCRRVADGLNGLRLPTTTATRLLLLTPTGFELMELSQEEYQKEYRELSDYPVAEVAKVFAEYAKYLGADKETLTILSKLTKITEDLKMTAQKVNAAKAKTTPAPAAKPAAKPVTAAAVPTGRTGKAKPTQKVAAEYAEYTSASQMFQALIMAGELTDLDIFYAVQAKFGLDDNKRGYVGWYRNNMRKKGMRVPDAKK